MELSGCLLLEEMLHRFCHPLTISNSLSDLVAYLTWIFLDSILSTLLVKVNLSIWYFRLEVSVGVEIRNCLIRLGKLGELVER